MTQKNDGGPAFPVQEDERLFGSYGMTLRDWFAGQVLTGMIMRNGLRGRGDVEWFEQLGASYAYQVADAMLAACDKG